MIVNGKTKILVNGKATRVGGRVFNRALRAGKLDVFCASVARRITPSRGLTWSDVASLIRAGKSVQARASVG